VSLPSAALDRPFAHRGLWTVGGRPENSLAAIEAACAAGYGVELDVQLSADGEAVVFHDETLERMTRQAGIVEERTADDLGRCRLLGSNETIPTLAQALAVIAGRAFVLVELKTPLGQEGALEQRVADLLESHVGQAAVIGFNSVSHAWFARHRPNIPRGLNVRTEAPANPRITSKERFDVAEPHFLLPSLDMAADADVLFRRAQGLPSIVWTVRRPSEWEGVRSVADGYIFEDFHP
jgi:glycerophosphoryl diester phosphodiesterase